MDLGVRPQSKMLWGEDIGPETDVDNPEVPPRDSRPESSQEDILDGSSESEEEEWKYVKGATKPEEKKPVDLHNDNKSQLNPNASEFYPGVEKFSPLDKDDFIAASPGMCQVTGNNLDDLDVPSETEFEHDISTRACDLDPAVDMDECAVVIEPQKHDNISSMGEDKQDGVSLILTPQGPDSEKIETNPFADDMKPNIGGVDRVDFVKDYFGKSELDFKPFDSASNQKDLQKPILSGDPSESHNLCSVTAEVSSHYDVSNSQPNKIAAYKPEESEKERNQLEIKEPESPAVSESCSNGIELEEHHNEIDDFPLDKSIELGLSSDRPIDIVVKPDHVETENDAFEAKSEKDSGLSVSDTTSDALPDNNGIIDNKENLNFGQEGSHFDSDDENSDEDAPNVEVSDLERNVEVGKDNVGDIINKEPVISNFVEEVLSDISQGESENKEDRPLTGLDEFHFDLTVPDNIACTKAHIEDSGLNHVDEFIKENRDDINPFFMEKDIVNMDDDVVMIKDVVVMDKDVVIYEEKLVVVKEHGEQFNGDKEMNLVVVDPSEASKNDTEKGDENVNIVNSVDVTTNLLNSLEITSEAKEPIRCVDEITNGIPCAEVISPAVEILSNKSLIAAQEVTSNVPEKCVNLVEQSVDDVEETRSPFENIINEITTKADVISNNDECINISDEKINHSDELELADTIGPNSFSFSQPYEIKGMSPSTFLRTMDNDIMTTSMHEQLENNWSVDFVSGNAQNSSPAVTEESVIPKVDLVNVPGNISEAALQNFETLQNGVDHVKSSPEILSFTNKLDETEKEVSPIETESAIVESHEVPVSSEPDLVFVEQICPTVEVHSDEASPVVTKENGGFELSPAINVAGVTAALGVAAAAAAVTLSDQQEETKKEEVKIAESKLSTKPPLKAPLAKKATAPATSKSPVTKSAPKVAPYKTTTAAAKPKVPAAPKSALTSTVNKTKTLPSKPTLTSATKPTSTAASTKPATKTTVAPITRAPPKSTTAPKTLTSANKPASRPASAPVKTTVTAKPAAPAKTTSSTTRAAPPAIKKIPPSTARPLLGSKTSALESKALPKTGPPKTGLPSTKPASLKTTSTIGVKPPSKLGVSAVTANKVKATSPTKPAPIKAKAPLAASKRPTSATTKKTSTVLDKNAKNSVKSVPKETEIIGTENQPTEEAANTTTNGHHIENGNITPLEEIPTHIM